MLTSTSLLILPAFMSRSLSTDHVKRYDSIETNVNTATINTNPPAHFINIDFSSGSMFLKKVKIFTFLAFFFFIFLFLDILMLRFLLVMLP